MAPPDAHGAPPQAAPAGSVGRGDNRLIRAVGRAPVRVRTKLLVAFAGMVALLVVIAVLGLRVLGQSNARIATLGTLQLRAATYQTLQTQAQQLRQLLAIRAAQGPNLRAYLEGRDLGPLSGHGWSLVDLTISAALSQLGPATNETRFGFVPPPEDEVVLRGIRADYRVFSGRLERIIALDGVGATSERVQPLLTDVINADNDLGARTDELASTTRAQTDALIAQNRSSYVASRNLFIAVGAASTLLALLLGFVISRSLIDPIRRTEARLAEIAAGDFTRHIEVTNRDELGSLSVNLNRMNDELRRLYEELESVSRHKSQFLAHMSHELRTPLNAIIGFSEILQQQVSGDLNEEQLGHIEDVLDAGRHLLSLINEILDLSKIEAGKMELDRSAVSLRSVLESGVTMHAERAARGGVALGLALNPEEITLRADERRLRQVVFNLMSNAVKSTPAGGRIDLSAEVVDGVVEVAVADTGRGIAPEDQEAIFEEFQQGRDNVAGRQEGTGLGLPLSRRLIELHGGRLWVESVTGRGSTFRFTLPVGPIEAYGIPATPAQIVSSRPSLLGAGALVLIVDDNEKNRRLARNVLGFAGFRTIEVASGADGVSIANEHLPDVILMDIRLPDMNGAKAVQLLKSDPRTARIPVVALTSLAMKGDREWFLAAGFDGYLEKPISVREFPAQVQSYVLAGAEASGE